MITNIIQLYDYFKENKYNPINWDILTDSIYFNGVNISEVKEILRECEKQRQNIKLIVYNENELILIIKY